MSDDLAYWRAEAQIWRLRFKAAAHHEGGSLAFSHDDMEAVCDVDIVEDNATPDMTWRLARHLERR